MSKKKATKRSKEKYPALQPRVNSRIRQEYIDYDYVDELSDEEKQWLNDFTEEFTNAVVGKQSEAENNRFHNTAELVKDCTDRNNAQNRCLYGRVRNRVAATKLLNYEDVINMVEDQLSREINPEEVEDAFIEYLDEEFVNNSSNTGEGSNNTD